MSTTRGTGTQYPAWGTPVEYPDAEVRTALHRVIEAIKRQGIDLETARIRREAIRIAHDGGLEPETIRSITGMSRVSIQRILEGTN